MLVPVWTSDDKGVFTNPGTVVSHGALTFLLVGAIEQKTDPDWRQGAVRLRSSLLTRRSDVSLLLACYKDNVASIWTA